MQVGDRVRIVEDEYPELVGLEGPIDEFSPDGTAAVVITASPFGMWCSVCNLVKVDSDE